MSSNFIYTDDFVTDLQNFPMPNIPEDASKALGGKTWDKESFPEHPFANSDFQKERVANGTHHLLNTVTVCNYNGKIILVTKEVYQNSTEYVHFMSNEGFRRRGIDTSTKKTNLGKKLSHSESSRARLSGEQRSDAQKKASVETAAKFAANLVECPHCKKRMKKPQAKQWHFDNCKTLREY